jgi:hypothetical protein
VSPGTVAGIGWAWVAGIAGVWWFVHRGTRKQMPTPPGHEHQGTAVPREDR